MNFEFLRLFGIIFGISRWRFGNSRKFWNLQLIFDKLRFGSLRKSSSYLRLSPEGFRRALGFYHLPGFIVLTSKSWLWFTLAMQCFTFPHSYYTKAAPICTNSFFRCISKWFPDRDQIFTQVDEYLRITIKRLWLLWPATRTFSNSFYFCIGVSITFLLDFKDVKYLVNSDLTARIALWLTHLAVAPFSNTTPTK